MSRHERPTLTPPFDPAKFARESESRLRSIPPAARNPRASVQNASAAAADEGLEDYVDVDVDVTEDAQDEENAEDAPSTARAPVSREAIPFVRPLPHELQQLNLDHRSGFVLSQIDGVSSVETIVDISAMPES